MAELSAETQAIIQRLKDEGNLIRNSGTNSIRSVKIEMAKFQDVFNTISANVIEQTSILRQQAGFAAEALEAQRTKEQFDEIQKETEERNTFSEPDSRETDEKIDKIGDSIANAFSLKNLALAGAGIFFGYNLLKGFIDQQYNGAWSEMEDGISALGPKLREFANFDIDGIREQFNQLVTDIGSMSTSLANISTSLGSIIDTFNRIADMNLLEIAGTVLLAMNSLSAAVWATRYVFRRMTLDLENGRRASGGRTWWQRALGINPETPNGTRATRFNPDGTVRGPGQDARPGQLRPPPTPRVAPVGGDRGTYLNDPANRAQMRANLAAQSPGQFRLDSRGRLQRTTGGVVADSEVLDILEQSIRQNAPRYARIFTGLTRGLIAVGIVFTARDLYRIYSILTDDTQYRTDQDKINAIGPIIGPMITSIGGGVFGAIAGSFVGGPWGALIGGAAGAIAAGLLTPEEFGIWVASALFEVAPSDEDRARIVSERESLAAATNEFAGVMGDTSYTGSTSNVPVTLSSRGRGRIVERPGERAAYMRQREAQTLDALIEAERNSQAEQQRLDEEIRALQDYLGVTPDSGRQRGLDTVSQNGGANPVVIINAPTTVSPTVNNVSGGQSVSQVSVRTGGMGPRSGDSSNPYGLSGGTN